MTLVDVVTSSTRLRPTTRKTYAKAVERFEVFAAGAPPTGAVVESWRDWRLAAGITATTVAKDMAAVKFASHRAASLGLTPIDFASAAEFPARPPWTPRKAPSAAECGAFEDACERDSSPAGLRDLAIFRISVRACGARRTELETLAVGDYKARMLSVARKGGWRQTISLDAATTHALDAWLSWRGGHGADPMFISLSRATSDQWVRGPGLTGSGIAHIVSARASQAGIRRRITPHLLRHAFVSLALAAGAPAHRVMVGAGHRSLSTTSRYVSDVEAEASPVGDAIETLLRRTPP